jgi:hypothetical protein
MAAMTVVLISKEVGHLGGVAALSRALRLFRFEHDGA